MCHECVFAITSIVDEPKNTQDVGKDWANRKGLALSCALEGRHVRQGQAAPIGCCGERPDVAEAYCLGGGSRVNYFEG